MLMQKCVAVDNHSFDVLQRAFDGACWSVGIPRCARQGEIQEISETRKTIALTVLRCAAAGARDVQALKASALNSLFSRECASPLLTSSLARGRQSDGGHSADDTHHSPRQIANVSYPPFSGHPAAAVHPFWPLAPILDSRRPDHA